MKQTAQSNPALRKLLNLAMLPVVAVLLAALYVKFTQHPAPRWTEYVFAAVWAMIGLQNLLFPNPRWTPLSRYGFASVLFALSLMIFLLTFFE